MNRSNDQASDQCWPSDHLHQWLLSSSCVPVYEERLNWIGILPPAGGTAASGDARHCCRKQHHSPWPPLSTAVGDVDGIMAGHISASSNNDSNPQGLLSNCIRTFSFCADHVRCYTYVNVDICNVALLLALLGFHSTAYAGLLGLYTYLIVQLLNPHICNIFTVCDLYLPDILHRSTLCKM